MEAKKEKILEEYFSTKKELVYRLWLLDETNIFKLRICYKLCDITTYQSSNNIGHCDFKFTNKSVAVEAYNEILDALNEAENDEFIDFTFIINDVKHNHNDLVKDSVEELNEDEKVYYKTN